MMRLSSSVRLTWSVGPGPSLGGVGGRPPGFLPVATALASRAAILASYSACSRACRSFARASMIARARTISASRCSRRASSSGIDIPSDGAQLQHAHHTGELQYLDEQGLDL